MRGDLSAARRILERAASRPDGALADLAEDAVLGELARRFRLARDGTVLVAVVVCTIAASAAAQVTAGQAARSGTAPTVDELMQRISPPTAYGGEREVLNRVPESLKDREPVETTADPLAQAAATITQQAPTAGVSFGGYDSDDNASQFGFRIMPPDTEGDVGLSYYVQYNNLGWKYFDKSGNLLKESLLDAGHKLAEKCIVPDDVYQMRALFSRWIADSGVQVIIATGGTGITGRDSTPEAIAPLLDKQVEQPDLTLLCVHGNPSWSYLWRDLLAHPPPGARVVATDAGAQYLLIPAGPPEPKAIAIKPAGFSQYGRVQIQIQKSTEFGQGLLRRGGEGLKTDVPIHAARQTLGLLRPPAVYVLQTPRGAYHTVAAP